MKYKVLKNDNEKNVLDGFVDVNQCSGFALIVQQVTLEKNIDEKTLTAAIKDQKVGFMALVIENAACTKNGTSFAKEVTTHVNEALALSMAQNYENIDESKAKLLFPPILHCFNPAILHFASKGKDFTKEHFWASTIDDQMVNVMDGLEHSFHCFPPSLEKVEDLQGEVKEEVINALKNANKNTILPPFFLFHLLTTQSKLDHVKSCIHCEDVDINNEKDLAVFYMFVVADNFARPIKTAKNEKINCLPNNSKEFAAAIESGQGKSLEDFDNMCGGIGLEVMVFMRLWYNKFLHKVEGKKDGKQPRAILTSHQFIALRLIPTFKMIHKQRKALSWYKEKLFLRFKTSRAKTRNNNNTFEEEFTINVG